MNKVYTILALAVLAFASSAQDFTSFVSGKLRYEIVDESNRYVRIAVKNPNNPDDVYQNIAATDFSAMVVYNGAEYTVLGVGPGAFAKASLSENTVTRLPEGFVYIDNGAFEDCTGISLRLPSTLTMLAPMALAGNKLRFLAVESDNPEFKSINVSSQSRNVSTIVNKAGNKLIAVAGAMVINFDGGNTNYVTQYEIPDDITEINEYAFYKHPNFARITIPASVTKIGDAAFYDCQKLTSVSLPNPEVELGISVWSGCSNLTSVSLPQGMEHLGRHTFYMCGLQNITLPEGMKHAGFMCFASNNLKTINLPSTMELIDSCCFQNNTELAEVDLKNVKGIDHFAFMGCSSLSSYTCNGMLERIGTSVFCRTALTDGLLPEGLLQLDGNNFFRTTSLTSVTIPSTVETIVYNPVVGCTALPRIQVAEGNTHFAEIDSCLYEIDAEGHAVRLIAVPQARVNKVLNVPEGVTALGLQAVREVPMEQVFLPATLLTITENTFSTSTAIALVTCLAIEPPASGIFADEVYAAATLRVPLVALDKYQTDEHWGKFQHIEGIDTGGEPAIDGDLNGDGNADIEDVNLLINIILDKVSANEITGNADLDGSGTPDVADVNLLINIILNQ